MPQTAVVIPTYNERDNIVGLLPEVLAATVPPLALGAGAVAAAVALGPSVPVGAALLLGAYPAALCLTGTVTRADLARWRT